MTTERGSCGMGTGTDSFRLCYTHIVHYSLYLLLAAFHAAFGKIYEWIFPPVALHLPEWRLRTTSALCPKWVIHDSHLLFSNWPTNLYSYSEWTIWVTRGYFAITERNGGNICLSVTISRQLILIQSLGCIAFIGTSTTHGVPSLLLILPRIVLKAVSTRTRLRG